jgi:hypothetical protein
MNQNNRPNYQNSIRWSQPYPSSRKRQIIDAMMDDLHGQMLDFIDQAVDVSDLSEAKTVIEYIRRK